VADRQPGQGRYAHLEREQRWLLSALPPDLSAPTEIYDRYLSGTRLRLRRTENAEGVVYKLGQKVRVDEANAERVKLTNIYLSATEYDVVAALEARELRKTRRSLLFDGRTFAIDEFATLGLILAEVELDADEDRLPVPPFADADVTDDDRYSGGSLAAGPK
jgi:CYTH domain-containing protein